LKILNREGVTLTFLVGILVFTSFMALTSPITSEQAVEISRNRPIVQKALQEASRLGYSKDAFYPAVSYWDAAYIRSLKQEYPHGSEEEKLPEDHGVWKILWVIMPPGYWILQFIDGLTGKILFESVILG
jgi:hypothetical protein